MTKPDNPICLIDGIGIFAVNYNCIWKLEERSISRNEKYEIIHNNPYIYRVSDTLWINLLSVNLITKKDGYFHIYFSGYGITYATHIECACLDPLVLQENYRVFEERMQYIDLDAMWEIDSIDGTHWVQIKNIVINDVYAGYITVHLETDERILLSDMSLSDFLMNIKTGVINKLII